MTAAIYLKRANKNIVIIEKEIPGGQINKTSNVGNYPGFNEISGPDLVGDIYNQIKSLNIPIIFDEVINIEDSVEKTITLKNQTITADGIILATGRVPKKLGLDLEDELVGKGISYCALCDGFFFKDKEVCVVGGGNSAFEESIYLANICKKVTILNRSNELKADDYLINQAKQRDNIEILLNSSISKINKDEFIKSVVVNGEEIKCDGLFIYIGLTPNTDYLKNLNINLENGYIVVDKNMRTNIDKIYACGDAIKKDVYQIITAAGEGAIAATSFERGY